MRSDAKNLAVIVAALKHHDRVCDEPALAVLMHPFEVERLGWEDVQGVPVKPEPRIQPGRFEILCDGEGSHPPAREAEEEKPVDAVAGDRLVTA